MTLNTRAKHIGLIVVAQIGCVATGLWLQHWYVMSTLWHTAEVTAWSNLDDAGNALAGWMREHDGALRDLEAMPLAEARRLLEAAPPARKRATILVDSEWRVMACVSALQMAQPCPAVGTVLAWEPSPETSDQVNTGRAGRLTLDDGEHIALAYPVGDGAGRIIVHRSAEVIHDRMAAAAGTLPLAGVLAAAWTCGLLGITVYMILSRQYDALDRERAGAEARSIGRIQTLVRTRDAVIFGLAKLADSRDPETGDHLERIAVYSSALASALREHTRYAEVITPNFVRLIGISSALHDIGKVGIEDRILLKPGKLTHAERARMQKHTLIGGECLRQIEYRLGRSNFLQMAREIALAHHERWDGAGYPNGLKGDAIPLSARIVSVADVYDALSSRRVYKAPMPHSECVQIIRAGSGTQFDPDIVEAWLSISDQFQDLALRYSSEPPPASAAGVDQRVTEAPTREEELAPA